MQAPSSIMSDVIFDNIFTDMAFHGLFCSFVPKPVTDSAFLRQDQGVRAQRRGSAAERKYPLLTTHRRKTDSPQLTKQIQNAKARTYTIGGDLNAAAEHLTRSRAALDTFRRNVFDRLTGDAPPLPAYSTTDEPGACAVPVLHLANRVCPTSRASSDATGPGREHLR